MRGCIGGVGGGGEEGLGVGERGGGEGRMGVGVSGGRERVIVNG